MCGGRSVNQVHRVGEVEMSFEGIPVSSCGVQTENKPIDLLAKKIIIEFSF